MEIKGKSLQICYGDYIAVNNIDIDVYKGQITSIVGPNASGKSTVLKAMTRLIDYKIGTVDISGKNIKNIGTKDFAKMVGVLPQKHSAPPDFKVKDLVGYGRVPYQKWYSSNSEEDDEIVEWAMRMLSVSHLKNKSINACSGGESQRIWIATVLAQQPEILFLDEPTTFLDIAHQLEMMKLVKKLNKESGIGIVMVLHDLNHALEVSDKIIVINQGTKYAEGTPKEVITPQMMKDVYGVDCDIIHIDGRSCPIIAYKEITQQAL